MKIFSPVAYGSGSFIIHKSLEEKIDGYVLRQYNPSLTFLPPLISLLRNKNADLIHVPIDYACFSKVRNKPLISTIHGYMLDDEIIEQAEFIKRIHYKTDLKYFIKKSIMQSNKIVCVSEFLKKKIIIQLCNQTK